MEEGKTGIYGIYDYFPVGSEEKVPLVSSEQFPIRNVMPSLDLFEKSVSSLMSDERLLEFSQKSTWLDKQYEWTIFRRSLGKLFGDAIAAKGNRQSFSAKLPGCTREQFLYLVNARRHGNRGDLFTGKSRTKIATYLHNDMTIRNVPTGAEDIFMMINTVYDLWHILGKRFSFWPLRTMHQTHLSAAERYKCIPFACKLRYCTTL
jgi:hypothetical protein